MNRIRATGKTDPRTFDPGAVTSLQGKVAQQKRQTSVDGAADPANKQYRMLRKPSLLRRSGKIVARTASGTEIVLPPVISCRIATSKSIDCFRTVVPKSHCIDESASQLARQSTR